MSAVGALGGVMRRGTIGTVWAGVCALILALPAADDARAQETTDAVAAEGAVDEAEHEDALQRLFARAEDGSGDAHLPFVLARLKRALAAQDLIAALDLVEPAYFEAQLAAVSRPGRSPGETLGQFACELFQVCDLSKSYRFADIVSARVLAVRPEEPPAFAAGPVEVTLELGLWDGQRVRARLSYDPATARLRGPAG